MTFESSASDVPDLDLQCFSNDEQQHAQSHSVPSQSPIVSNSIANHENTNNDDPMVISDRPQSNVCAASSQSPIGPNWVANHENINKNDPNRPQSCVSAASSQSLTVPNCVVKYENINNSHPDCPQNHVSVASSQSPMIPNCVINYENINNNHPNCTESHVSDAASCQSPIGQNCVANLDNLNKGDRNHSPSHFFGAAQPSRGHDCNANCQNQNYGYLNYPQGPGNFSPFQFLRSLNPVAFHGNQSNVPPNFPQRHTFGASQFARGFNYVPSYGYQNNGDPNYPASYLAATFQSPRVPNSVANLQNQSIGNLNYPPGLLNGPGNFSASSQLPRGSNHVTQSNGVPNPQTSNFPAAVRLQNLVNRISNLKNLNKSDRNYPQSRSTASKSLKGSKNVANRNGQTLPGVPPVESDSNRSFLLSLLPEIESMSDLERMDFKIQVYGLLKNLKYPRTQNPLPKSDTS